MRAARVVPGEPGSEALLRVREILELMLPDTFLFETAKEAFDDPVLLRRVWRDEFLGQAIVLTRGSEPTALKDEPLVTAHDRHGALRAQRPESLQAGRLKRPLRLLGTAAQRKLIANDFTIMTIDDCGQMSPAVCSTRNMGHVHHPPLIAGLGSTAPASYPWPRHARPLMDQPALELENPIDHFAIHSKALPIPQQGPEPPIAKRRMLHQQLMEPRRQRGQQPWRRRLSLSADGTTLRGTPAGPGSFGVPRHPVWPASLVGCPSGQRVRFQGLPQDIVVEDQFADLLFELLDLLFFKRLFVFGPTP
jgi:hypothetical protein